MYRLLILIALCICCEVKATDTAADTSWIAVSIDSTRTKGDPDVEFFRQPNGTIWCRAFWHVGPGSYDLILFPAREGAPVWARRLIYEDSSLVTVAFAAIDSLGPICKGASLRVVK